MTATSPRSSAAGWLDAATAPTRFVAGSLLLAASILPVHRDRVDGWEASLFRAVNHLPDALFPPAWVVMQAGNVGAAPAAAAVAWLSGDRRLAGRLLTAGVATWAGSKVVKRFTRRPRPRALLPDARLRGREASGLGYPSGHAGVAVALGVAALPHLRPGPRRAAALVVPAVGLSRMYVGAHLPLDVLSGAALGLLVDAVVAAVTDAEPR